MKPKRIDRSTPQHRKDTNKNSLLGKQRNEVLITSEVPAQVYYGRGAVNTGRLIAFSGALNWRGFVQAADHFSPGAATRRTYP
jgi:hypothetical protein